MLETVIVGIVYIVLAYLGALLIGFLACLCADGWDYYQRQRAARAEAELDRQAEALRLQINALAAELGGDRDRAIRRMANIADALSGTSRRS